MVCYCYPNTTCLQQSMSSFTSGCESGLIIELMNWSMSLTTLPAFFSSWVLVQASRPNDWNWDGVNVAFWEGFKAESLAWKEHPQECDAPAPTLCLYNLLITCIRAVWWVNVSEATAWHFRAGIAASSQGNTQEYPKQPSSPLSAPLDMTEASYFSKRRREQDNSEGKNILSLCFAIGEGAHEDSYHLSACLYSLFPRHVFNVLQAIAGFNTVLLQVEESAFQSSGRMEARSSSSHFMVSCVCRPWHSRPTRVLSRRHSPAVSADKPTTSTRRAGPQIEILLKPQDMSKSTDMADAALTLAAAERKESQDVLKGFGVACPSDKGHDALSGLTEVGTVLTWPQDAAQYAGCWQIVLCLVICFLRNSISHLLLILSMAVTVSIPIFTLDRCLSLCFMSHVKND